MFRFPRSFRRRLGLTVLVLAGCTTEYVSPVPFERARILGAVDTRWLITGRVTTYNGRPIDVFASSDTCVKDNYRILRTDSVLMWRRGRLPCTPITPDTVLGRWTMSPDYETLTLENDPDLERRVYQIRDLSDSLMVLRWAETLANGTALTETVSLRQVK